MTKLSEISLEYPRSALVVLKWPELLKKYLPKIPQIGPNYPKLVQITPHWTKLPKLFRNVCMVWWTQWAEPTNDPHVAFSTRIQNMVAQIQIPKFAPMENPETDDLPPRTCKKTSKPNALKGGMVLTRHFKPNVVHILIEVVTDRPRASRRADSIREGGA